MSLHQTLWHAADIGDAELVSELMENPEVNVNHRDPQLQTSALLRASTLGHTQVVTALLRRPQIDVNLTNGHGWSPLLVACHFGLKEIVKLLLADPRTNVNIQLQEAWTPLLVASSEGRDDVVELLLKDPRVEVNAPGGRREVTALFLACESHHLTLIKRLLADPRIDVNSVTPKGSTAFFFACVAGDEGVVGLMLQDPRVDVTRPDRYGSSPFFIACQHSNEGVVRLMLQDPRVDPNTPMLDGQTPCSVALEMNNLGVFKLLLALGSDIKTDALVDVEKTLSFELPEDWLAFASGFEKSFITPREIGEKKGHLNCVALLDEFQRDRSSVKLRLWEELELQGLVAAELFVLVVFLSDDYLALPPPTTPEVIRIRRFLAISRRLPIELQMVLCNRTCGSPKDLIPMLLSEPAFRTLAWRFHIAEAERGKQAHIKEMSECEDEELDE